MQAQLGTLSSLPAAFWAVCAFVVGLLVGSFLNVIIERVPSGRSIGGRSACPACGSEIAWFDNIPVASWIALRAKCRSCGSRISARYPLVELGTAALFVISLWRFGYTANTLVSIVLLSTLLALALIDYDCQRLPNPIVLTLALMSALIIVGASVASWRWRPAIEAAIAGVVSFGVFAAIAELSYVATKRVGMAWGDVKLAGAIGLSLGFIGPRFVVVAFFAAFVTGAIGGIALILFAGGNRRSTVPFGVYLAVGAFVSILFADPIFNWYISIGAA